MWRQLGPNVQVRKGDQRSTTHGFNVSVAVFATEFNVAVRASGVVVRTTEVVTVKTALDAPGATVTVAG